MWVLANILQLATQEFYRIIRLILPTVLCDQMVMAARCGVANIAEVRLEYPLHRD